ncbi:MAG: flavin reductase [Bacilli bacterium]|jgi:flavin reductase (DIM6/NTAB) family NADH-FMN oxidoreductase RutF|nr:flavin reductase [Bacilli bacterium]
MRKNFGAKALLCPEMALVVGTYDENGKANAMVAAWGGVSDDQEVTICIGGNHKTADNLLSKKAFSLSIGGKESLSKIDFVGVLSGKSDPDKVTEAGLSPEKGAFVDAPTFSELPFVMECRLKSYDKESCRLVGEIVNVAVDESVLDEKGRIDFGKWRPLCYDPFSQSYVEVGPVAGPAFQKPQKR